MNNQLPPIDDFIDDEITEADFKVALTRLHAYLTEAVGANGENITAAVTVTNTGSGNAVTAVSANGSAITVTKGNSFVPATRTISGKPLSADITLEAADISDFSQTIMSRDNGSLALGSYVIAWPYKDSNTNSVSVSNGEPIDGTSLRRVHFHKFTSSREADSTGEFFEEGTSLTGTWRNVSGVTLSYSKGDYQRTHWRAGLFQRIL